MKQVRMAAILMALVLGGLSSCTKDNSGTSSASTISTNSTNKSGPVQGKGAIALALEQGRWVVSSYTGAQPGGTDFTGYDFTFFEPSYVAATYGEVVYNGSWSANDQANTFFIDFGVTATVLNALKGEWQVTQLSNESISFHRTTGNGEASFTFQKVGPNTPQ